MQSHNTPRRRRRAAFTLVELLVVIGIIAILISVLLPVLGAARRASEKTTCLASLNQIHNAYKMYQIDNKGAWPVSVHFWRDPNTLPMRDKRYHDFIAKYLIGNQSVTKPDNTKISTNEMNSNGTLSATNIGGIGNYQTHGDFGTDLDPVWIGTMKNRKNVLWGCPSWSKMGYAGQYEYGVNNGYTMNQFPQAPNDLDGAGAIIPSKVARIIGAGSDAGTAFPGNYFKMTQWSRAGERALLFDGIFNAGYMNAAWLRGESTTVSGGTFDPLDPSAKLPRQGDSTVWMDWNRHTKAKVGAVKNGDPAFNMLFVDGHAATVSTYEAFKAIRFK
jgi:prepilin-type N-terminal cleavage/methylation domain-containing protein/prepilin-type processing-associated H-X9-DG protein